MMIGLEGTTYQMTGSRTEGRRDFTQKKAIKEESKKKNEKRG
jgi:hypothetical protein